MSARSPIHRILGDVDLSAGPFGLLGLPAGDVDRVRIERALRERLALIEAHPLHASPEANEVRLALHVAAAQLRDPGVRSALLARWGMGSGSERVGEVAGAPVEELDPGEALYRDMVLQVLVHSGGWNEVAKHRLAAITHAQGRSLNELVRSLRVAAQSPRPQGGRAPEAHREAAGEIAAPPSSARRWAVTIATVVLALGTLFMGGAVFRIVRAAVGNAPAGGAAVSTPDSARRTIPSAQAQLAFRTPDGRVELTDPDELLAGMRRAAETADTDPDGSLTAMRESIGALSRNWTRVPPPTLNAMHSAVSDYVFQAARRAGGAPDRALAVVLEPVERLNHVVGYPAPTELVEGLWGLGVLVRLSRDDDLPPSVRSAIDGALRPSVELSDRLPGEAEEQPSFWGGLDTGLRALAVRNTPEGGTTDADRADASWRAWAAVLGHYAEQDGRKAEQLALDVIEMVLVAGTDVRVSRAATALLNQLVALPAWSESPSAAQRLYRWFSDRRISESDMASLTEALASSPDVSGIPPGLMLSPSASPAERTALRDRYAEVLPMPETGEQRRDADQWAARAGELLAAPMGGGGRDSLVSAVALARLNESAALLWRQAGGAGAALEDADTERVIARLAPLIANQAAFDPAVLTNPGSENDGVWARRLLRDRNRREVVLRLVNELGNAGGPVGPADADVLAWVAVRHNNRGVREAAQRVCVRHRVSPLVVNGVLESLSDASKAGDVGRFVERLTDRSLPATAGPEWALEARRALVGVLLDAISASLDPAVEWAAVMFEEAYQTRVSALRDDAPSRARLLPRAMSSGGFSLADAPGEEVEPRTGRPEQPAGALFALWLGSAERYIEGEWTFMPLDEVQRRRTGRLRLARGAVERFAAEQVSLTEVMAYVIAAERPSRAARVEAVVLELGAQRRRAVDVFGQFEACERAQARLWMIRSGMEDRV